MLKLLLTDLLWLFMTTSSASPQQISISAGQAVSVYNVSIDSSLALVPALRRIDQYNFPALHAEMQDPLTVGVQDLPSVQDGHHSIPGPSEGRTTSEHGDAVNEQLLHNEALDIEAVRTILKLPIVNNTITVKHYWLIAKSLRNELLQAGPHEIPYGEAYTRILLRLMERLMTYPSGRDSDYVLYYRPRDYVECLDKLLTDMAQGFVINQQTGIEDDVFIIRNKDLYIDHLCSLVSRLKGNT